ncbi:unnamed protein product [Calicophoron daubneyi]|uniref:SBF1/SBF2 domain-containing protein n=1 Tax=Calicophoron daubneyi TaxID=300641 RepID=A0AAV2TAR8_CALDB
MSFGNFLRRISFETDRTPTDPQTTEAQGTGIDSILAAPGKFLGSVNAKTGHLVSDLNQKLDLGGKFDTFKQASVTKFEHVVRGSTSSQDSAEDHTRSSGHRGPLTNPFNAGSPATSIDGKTADQTTHDESSSRKTSDGSFSQLRRQSTNAGPRPPRPPPPTPAALSRAMSLDETNLTRKKSTDENEPKRVVITPTLEMAREEEEPPPGQEGGPGDQGLYFPTASSKLAAPTRRRKSPPIEEEADSSASEYGAHGDQPIYKTSEKKEGGPKPDNVTPRGHAGTEEEFHESQMEVIIEVCVSALLSGRWVDEQSHESELQNLLGNAGGRMTFVNKIEQEAGKVGGVLDAHAVQPLLEKVSYMLNECQEAEDFAPAKKLLTTSLLFYVVDQSNPEDKQPFFNYVKTQPIWQSLRFWNACFFQSVQEARAKLGDQNGNESQQQEIVVQQLRSYLNTMNVFGLHHTIKQEFLRKHGSLFNLTDDQMANLRLIAEIGQ